MRNHIREAADIAWAIYLAALLAGASAGIAALAGWIMGRWSA